MTGRANESNAKKFARQRLTLLETRRPTQASASPSGISSAEQACQQLGNALFTLQISETHTLEFLTDFSEVFKSTL